MIENNIITNGKDDTRTNHSYFMKVIGNQSGTKS